MKSKWQPKRLGEVVRLRRGHDLTAKERRPGKVPVMGSAGHNGFHDTALMDGPGVVIGRSGGSMGRVHYVQEPYWPHNTCLYVTDFLGNNASYIYYMLQALDFSGYNSGSAQPSLNRNLIYDVTVRIPPRNQQDRIADIGNVLDERLEVISLQNITLESIARAIFKSWFIAFDPAHAKAAGQAPEGIDSETAALFPSESEDSELGSIPKGWKVCPFSDTVDVLGGGTPRTSIKEYWNGDIPWYAAGDAPADGQVFVIDTERRITQLGLENSSTRILPPWTTIVSARGSVGKLALTGVEMAMNQTCYGLRSKFEHGDIFTYLATQQLVRDMRRLAHGAIFDTITRSTLRSLSVTLPDEPILKAFDHITRPLFERILNNVHSIETLAALRDTLLPRLISGRLRIPEAEEIVEEAVS